MKNAKVLEQKEVIKILAEYFKIPESNIVKMQYSYVIIEPTDSREEDNVKKIQ